MNCATDAATGYVQLPRCILTSPMFHSKDERLFFIDLYAQAAWKTTGKPLADGHHVELVRGEILITERDLAKESELHRNTIRRLFDRLERAGWITFSPAPGLRSNGTIATILIYEGYEGVKVPRVRNLGKVETVVVSEVVPLVETNIYMDEEGKTKKEEESPLPPEGVKVESVHGQEVQPTTKPAAILPESNRTLFPVQEVQVSTKKRRSGSRKDRLKHFVPNPSLDADWQEFVAEYPDRDPVNPAKVGRMVFEEVIEAGVDPSDLINGAMAYCRSVKRAGKEGTGSVRHYTTFLDIDEKFWMQCIEGELRRNGQRSGNVTQFPKTNPRQVAV